MTIRQSEIMKETGVDVPGQPAAGQQLNGNSTCNTDPASYKTFFPYTIPVIVILLMGLIHLPHPFYGDQALFMVGARELSAGGKLYVDFWDIKQPGIYLFYWLAGGLFGYTEVGVHALELIVFCGLSLFMVFSLKPYFNHQWLASLVPVATIGTYYCMTGSMHLTQVEILVGIPLFLCARLSSIDGKNRFFQLSRWFMSGVSAGVVAIFKLVLAPIPVVMWLLVIIIRLRSAERQSKKEIISDAAAACCGVAVVLALIAFWFASNNALDELWYTNFVYPLQAVADAPAAGLDRLIRSLSWFGRKTIFFLFISSFVAFNWRSIKRETVTIQMMGWLVAGFLVILIQKFSYWQYHFMLLLFPIGVLSVRGIDAVLTKYADAKAVSGRRTKALALAFLMVFFAFSPVIQLMGKKCIRFSIELVKGSSWSGDYQMHLSKAYRAISKSTTFLAEDHSDRAIYVFGDPLNYYLNQKRQAIPENGWGWEFYMPEQLNALISELDQARPVYLFISDWYADLFLHKLPHLFDFVNRHYFEYSKSDDGKWYRLKAPDPASNLEPNSGKS